MKPVVASTVLIPDFYGIRIITIKKGVVMSTLSGKNRVGFSDLQMVPPPERTKSYVPVRHDELANMTRSIAGNILHDFSLYKEEYVLAREGRHMFGVLTYKNHSDEMGLSIGIRNSYDKSLSVGCTLGASVFVCDNLVFKGDIAVFRKHTSNVLQDIGQMILSAIYAQKEKYERIQQDAEHLKRLDITDDTAFRLMGLLFGKGIVTPRQLPTIKENWLNPPYEDFEGRNAWSLYNSCTEALKTTPPALIMQKHIQLHGVFFGNGGAA
jgi:hypothetical protein